MAFADLCLHPHVLAPDVSLPCRISTDTVHRQHLLPLVLVSFLHAGFARLSHGHLPHASPSLGLGSPGHPWKSRTRQHSLNYCWLIPLSPFLGGCCGVLNCTRPRPCLHLLVWNSLAFCPCLAILSSPSSCKGPYLLWPGSCPSVPEELALVPSRSGSPCSASPCLTPAILPSSPSGCSLALPFLCHRLSKSSSKIVFSLPQLFTIWSSLSLIGCSQKLVFFPRNQLTFFTFAPWDIGC